METPADLFVPSTPVAGSRFAARFTTSLTARLAALAPGLLLTAAIAAAAIGLGGIGWLSAHGIGALTLAIVIGIVAGNVFPPAIAPASDAGVGFSKQKLLRLGIVLYGLRLTFRDIGDVGVEGVLIDALVLTSTFGIACLVGTRLLGLDRETAMLIGAGSSICGAAAVMATGPVVRGRAEQVAVAVATVVVFGTIAIVLYPLLQRGLLLTPKAYGLFAGSTIHEVAQVVAAGRAMGDQAGDTAVIAKMVRVMMLAPFLVALSAWLSRRRGGAAGARGGIVVPWFAFAFVAVAGLHSAIALPKPVVDAMLDLDTFLLAMAMAGLGLTTRASAIREAGVKPLMLAAVLFAWLVGGGLAINLAVGHLFAR